MQDVNDRDNGEGVIKEYMPTHCTFHSLFYKPKTVLKIKFMN